MTLLPAVAPVPVVRYRFTLLPLVAAVRPKPPKLVTYAPFELQVPLTNEYLLMLPAVALEADTI